MAIALRFPKGFKTSIRESDSFEIGQIRALLESGKIPKGTLARAEGAASWVSVDAILPPAPNATAKSPTYGLVPEAPPPPDQSSSYLNSLSQISTAPVALSPLLSRGQVRPPAPQVGIDFEEEIEQEFEEKKQRKTAGPFYPNWLVAMSLVLLVLCLVGVSFWVGYRVGCAQSQVNEAVALLKNMAEGPLAEFDLPLLPEELRERRKDDPKSVPAAAPPRGLPKHGPKAALIADDEDAPPVPPGRMIRNARDIIEFVDGAQRIRLWNFSKTSRHFMRPNSQIPILVLRCDFSVENMDRNAATTVAFGWKDLAKLLPAKLGQLGVTGVDEFKSQVNLYPWESKLAEQLSRNLAPGESFVTPLRSTELAPAARTLNVTLAGSSGKTMTFGIDLVSLQPYRGQ